MPAWLARIRHRLGSWFWVLAILLVPIVLHEFDHLVLAFSDAQRFPADPETTETSIDNLIHQRWGERASLWWHNAIVFLGGIALLIPLGVLGRPQLDDNA